MGVLKAAVRFSFIANVLPEVMSFCQLASRALARSTRSHG
jgi:hypothetical protein